jgi:hypothetical protein
MAESAEVRDQRARVAFHVARNDHAAVQAATERLNRMLEQARQEANPPRPQAERRHG